MNKKKVIKANQGNKVIKLDEKEVKRLQRKQFQEKRRKQKLEIKTRIKKIKFNKSELIVFAIILLVIITYYILMNYHKLGIVFDKNISQRDSTMVETMYTDNVVAGYKDSVLVFENN